MRSKILIFLIILSSVPAFAQKISFSAKAGAVYTGMQISLKDLPVSINLNRRLNSIWGLAVNYSINKTFGLQSEICYYQHSSELSFAYTINADKNDITKVTVYPSATIRMSSFYFPVIFKYHANKHISLYIGLYGSKRGDINAKLNSIAARAINQYFSDQQISDGTVETAAENELDNDLHKWSFGLLTGIQYAINKHFFADLRVQRSYTNLAKDMDLRTFASKFVDIPSGLNFKPRMYLSSIELSLGYNL
jgi:opacity protein-like surface antigen